MAVAILYRWRIKPGMEDQFRAAWERGTRAIHERCGSFGARLHRAADGSFVSYALWPSDAARKDCFANQDFTGEGMEAMQDAVAERFDDEVLEVTADLLEAL